MINVDFMGFIDNSQLFAKDNFQEQLNYRGIEGGLLDRIQDHKQV